MIVLSSIYPLLYYKYNKLLSKRKIFCDVPHNYYKIQKCFLQDMINQLIKPFGKSGNTVW
mgnify:CR=1 FL=1